MLECNKMSNHCNTCNAVSTLIAYLDLHVPTVCVSQTYKRSARNDSIMSCLYFPDIETKLLKADEVFDKFPKLFNHVSDDTKAKLLKFLETKVNLLKLTT